MTFRIVVLALMVGLGVGPGFGKASTHKTPAVKTQRAESASAKNRQSPGTETTATAAASSGDVTITASDLSSTVTEEIRKADAKTADEPKDNVLLISLSGDMPERGEPLSLFGEKSKSLKGYLDTIRKARDDKNVKTVVFRLTASSFGLATAQELAMAISELRAKGKKTYGVIEDDSQASYIVAAACGEVVLPPSADLMLYGVKAEGYFFRSLLEKIGVNAQIIHVGKYKSYGEMFTEDDFTSPARENMTEIVDDVYGQLVDAISSSRKITREEAEAAINRGPSSAQEAKDAKLIDRIGYADDLLDELRKSGATILDDSDYAKDKADKSDEVSIFSLLSAISRQQGSSQDKSSKYPQVAVVYAVGPIMLGSDQGVGFGNETEIYSDDFISTLDEIQKDKKIKAVILRVNSPGGSAFASDLIWKKMEELKRTKPVVASMGDVAASGGYYIAMGATKIVAHGGTFTGSIGVVGGKFNLSGGYGKLGIRKTTISKGSFASLFSETSDFNPQERALIERMMGKTYDEFITKAAQGRKLPKEKMNELAQGKVWVGSRAKDVGLVDEIGGLAQAISDAKILMGLKADEKVSLISYPKEVGILDLLQKAFGTGVSARSSTGVQAMAALGMTVAPSQELRGVFQHAQILVRLFGRERVVALMPFFMSVKY